ncbi:hypothetical protein KFZ58_14980 [Virgibacillus sp. NKC19-16]|nr:hypothetical protein [Virgibacillus sp. NKC19-16]UJL45681.1 hypothetical protein KFZ58_14980 [Virgibacillus sp. NKC19-16]
MRAYSDDEVQEIIQLKQCGYTDKEIANLIGRSYWSVVYKLSELKKSL